MEILTSFFSNIPKLPKSVLAVGIARTVPKGIPAYRALAPTPELLSDYKAGYVDEEAYVRRFRRGTLDRLDLDAVMRDLARISGGRDVALCCYEKPGDFCHRHLVAGWLMEHGVVCGEFENAEPHQNLLPGFPS